MEPSNQAHSCFTSCLQCILFTMANTSHMCMPCYQTKPLPLTIASLTSSKNHAWKLAYTSILQSSCLTLKQASFVQLLFSSQEHAIKVASTISHRQYGELCKTMDYKCNTLPIRLFIRRLMALAFLPEWEISIYYTELKQRKPTVIPQLDNLLRYFENTWLDGGQFSPAMWSVFDQDGSRTLSTLTMWELTKWEVDKVGIDEVKLTKWELTKWELTKWEDTHQSIVFPCIDPPPPPPPPPIKDCSM